MPAELPPWQERLALVLVMLQANAADYDVLYRRGGGHQKDLDKARMCESLAYLIGSLFPELAE